MKSRPARPTALWIEPEPVEVLEEVRRAVGGDDFLSQSLVRRGIFDYASAQSFLDPAKYTPASPSDLPDLDRAADRIEEAIRRGECIGVWGDFDVDGQTSTTLLVSTLRKLGANVIYHIPVRSRESHGVNLDGLKSFIASGAQLVLTCDTGITAHEAALYARQQGVDFIITDHHTLPPELPAAYAAVNPQRLPEGHPLRTLPGVGTSYKLAEALACRAGQPEIAAAQLDLVALGTVADLAILTGDARYLVQLGLRALQKPSRLGLQVLLSNAEVNPDFLGEEHIGFAIAPRLNAIGRLDDANPVVEFLTTDDLSVAKITANTLEGLNNHRKILCDQVFEAAYAQIEKTPSLLDEPALVLSHSQWPAGVIGIVASRLVDLYHKPTILLSAPTGRTAHGSARSVEGVNITAAIAETQRLLLGFGGHPMAAGLSMNGELIPEFRKALGRAVARQMKGLDLTPRLPIESYLSLYQISLDFVENLSRLAPFGPGNPAPVFACRNLALQSSTHLGKNQDHLQLLVEDENGRVQKVIWWQGAGAPLPEGRFDLAFSLRASNFRGQREVAVEYVDARVIDEPQEIREPAPRIELIDHRAELDPRQLLEQLAASEPGLLVYQEGENLSKLPGSDRYHLAHAPTLALWSIPPSRAVLDEILSRVTPRKIVFFGVNPASDQPLGFATRLAGLLRYAIKELHGSVPLARLAASTAQREVTVSKGLSWLEARGTVQVVREADGNLIVMEGGRPDPSAASKLETELTALLQETAAFRAYYLRAPLESLLSY